MLVNFKYFLTNRVKKMYPGDSIAGYDSSHEMYHAGPTLRQMQDYQSNRVNSKDTIQGFDDLKQEKYHTQKIEPSQFQIPKEKIVEIGRIGRFIFTAIVTPTYILTYSMPKWVATEFIPQMFHQMQKGFEQGKYWLELAGKWLAKSFATPFRTFVDRLNWAMQAVEKKAYDFLGLLNKGYAHIKNSLFRLTPNLLKPFDIVNQQAKTMLEKTMTSLKGVYQRTKKALEKPYSMIKEGMTRLYQLTLIRPYQWVNHAYHRGYNKVKPIVNKLQEVTKKTVEQVKIPFQKGRESVDNAIKTLQNQVVQVIQHVQVTSIPVINFFVVPFNKIVEKTNLSLRWCKGKGKNGYKHFKGRMKQVKDRVSKISYEIKSKVASITYKFLNWLFGPFLAWLFKKFPFIPKMLSLIQQFFKALIPLVKRCIVKIKELKNKYLSAILKAAFFISKKASNLILRPKDSLITFFKVIRYGFVFAAAFLKGVLISIYVFVYLCYLFWNQGMALVHELSNSSTGNKA